MRFAIGVFLGVSLAASPVAFARVHGRAPHSKRPERGKAPVVGAVQSTQAPTKAVESAPAKEVSAATAPRGPTRIDFDDRLIQGQSNKSGAVYLFDRKESALRSMVHRRTSFRDEIVKDVLD